MEAVAARERLPKRAVSPGIPGYVVDPSDIEVPVLPDIEVIIPGPPTSVETTNKEPEAARSTELDAPPRATHPHRPRVRTVVLHNCGSLITPYL